VPIVQEISGQRHQQAGMQTLQGQTAIEGKKGVVWGADSE